MKTLFLLFFFTCAPFPLLASAAPSATPALYLPGEGTAEFRGSFQVIQKRRVEIVHAFNAKGRERLEQLRGESYACVHIEGATYRCSAFVDNEGTEGEIRTQVEKHLAGLNVGFGARVGEPELVVEGETYQEWSVNQPVRFLGRAYADYRYGILGDTLHKIAFGDPTESSLLAHADGSFGYVTDFARQENRSVMFTYLVEAKLVR